MVLSGTLLSQNDLFDLEKLKNYEAKIMHLARKLSTENCSLTYCRNLQIKCV